MMKATLVSCLTMVVLLSAGASGAAKQEVLSERLGEVSFPVSCNAEAQKEWNRAMALFHSFWFERAIRSFSRVLELDPECGMAHWGMAIMSMGNPFGWQLNPGAFSAGAPHMAEALRVGTKSERERDYIAALALLYKDRETVGYGQRAGAFVKALEELAARYPEDDEARILYAIMLTVTASPADKTFANQLKAAAILEPLYKKYPSHPGVAHYLIHSYDYAELAERGLPYARAYASIAPSVPHALHMPSHIFSRLGLWQEMVESNRASYIAAKAELSRATLGVGSYDALHAMDYMVFGLLQQARDRAAKELLDEVAAIRTEKVEDLASAYAFTAIPSRYALERGDWRQAAGLRLMPSGMDWSRFPQAEAILVFARGIGAARSGDVTDARKDVDRLLALKAAMEAAKLGYWAVQTEFQVRAVNAWIALAEGRRDEAVRLMREAAEAEAASDKHPVTPGNVAPTRELLGEMLLELNQPAQALTEFERSLKRDPNRFRALSGAGRAAEASGNSKAARDYYARLVETAPMVDTERPALVHAKKFLAFKGKAGSE